VSGFAPGAACRRGRLLAWPLGAAVRGRRGLRGQGRPAGPSAWPMPQAALRPEGRPR